MWKKTFQFTMHRAYHYHFRTPLTTKQPEKPFKQIQTLLEEVKYINERLSKLEKTLKQIVYGNTDGK